MSTQIEASGRGMAIRAPAIRAVGPITFGPDGILFIADNVSARVFAVDVADRGEPVGHVDVEQLDSRLAAYLGCPREDVFVRDMAIHPGSQRVYLSVMRGSGDAAVPMIIRVGDDGSLADVAPQELPFSSVSIADAPAEDDDRQDVMLAAPGETPDEELEVHGHRLRLRRRPLRTQTVTDLAFVDGVLLVAGASNEEFVATLRRIPFPFTGEAEASSLEIFHVSHGKYETHSPLRTLVPYDGGRSVLAAYTCTPVVRFSLADLRSGEQAKGRTVAELGAMNTPIDMVSYTRAGEEYLLVSNARHPLIKLARRDIDAQEPLTEPHAPRGVPREEAPPPGRHAPRRRRRPRPDAAVERRRPGVARIRQQLALELAWSRSRDGVCFTPRFPFLAGTTYVVRVGERSWTLRRADQETAVPRARVLEIYPTAETLPLNQLKLYVVFSAAMSEGSANRTVSLRRADGSGRLEGALLPMEPELWDRDRTRLTLLLDPGRIKRGLLGTTRPDTRSRRASRSWSPSRGRSATPPVARCWPPQSAATTSARRCARRSTPASGRSRRPHPRRANV